MHKQKYFSANSVTSMVTWLIIAMMIASIALMTFFLHVIDTQSQATMISRIKAASKHESIRLNDLSYEYTNWNFGYQKTVIEQDQAWIDQYYQKYLPSHYNLDLIALVKGDHTVQLLGGKIANANNYAQALVTSPSILLKLELAKKRQNKYIGNVFATQLGDSLYVMTADPFTDEDTGKTLDDCLLVFARKLDDNLLSQFSAAYELPKLYLNSPDADFDTTLKINNLTGTPMATMSWNIKRTTTTYLPYLVVFLIFLLCIALFIVRALLKNNQKYREQYEDELYEAATTDPLTNSYNKRYLASYALHQIQLYEQRNKELSLLTLDLDHFKSINDKYGHHVGDAALVHFCKVCNETLRTIDVLGRIGGEEFAIILPNVNLIEASNIAERIRHHVSNSPLKIDDHVLKLTVSIGVTTRRDGCTFSELLKEADRAMYQAKESGRNKVVSYKV